MPAKELKQDDMISKHFNIDHIEEGLILIYPVPKDPPSKNHRGADSYNRRQTKGFGGGVHAKRGAARGFLPHEHEKRKASEAFDDEFDYLYGIVTTASDWYFLMYTPERIYCSKADYHIALTEDILDDDT
ncbi:hypothetical protein C1645_803641 [Glomus cerebriforme]|uniref:Uncharacterized protein n=1 Tax=Glomus cerebriforme TaxID=658196 RepID=A0A397TH93_9GLOM|nr:hypothetical protein C1645_803641 [Glomus cerebriforme]